MKTNKTKIEVEETAVALAPSKEALEMLKQAFPAEVGYEKLYLPRIEYVSQDKMEGEGKNKKCVIEAGTFFLSKETTSKDTEGKTVWSKDEIGKEMEAVIVFSRKQLKYYDNALETFTSSTVYDEDDESIALFCGGAKIAEGKPEDLKKRYEYRDEDGKVKSKLEDNKILIVLYKGELYNLSLRGSSMWSYKSFAKKTQNIPAQLTKFYSEARTKGQISWNAMMFDKSRDLNADEVGEVMSKVIEIKSAIGSEKAYYKKDKEIENTVVAYPTSDESNDGSGFDLIDPPKMGSN